MARFSLKLIINDAFSSLIIMEIRMRLECGAYKKDLEFSCKQHHCVVDTDERMQTLYFSLFAFAAIIS